MSFPFFLPNKLLKCPAYLPIIAFSRAMRGFCPIALRAKLKGPDRGNVMFFV